MDVARQPEGKLELTWTNKHLALLKLEDGLYQWVSPSDYRVAEVRLLRDAGTFGDTYADGRRARDNLLIRGDAVNALRSLGKLPEFAKELVGKVKLVYIDPPFNTGEAFEHYDDNLEHSVWLTMMRDRLDQIEALLAPDGSVWVHLSDDEAHYAKVLMDELFQRANFIATFIWRKVDSPSDNKVPLAVDHDYILCYSKKPGATSFPQKPDPSVGEAYGSLDEKSGQRYRDRLLKKNGKNSLRKDRPTMWYGIEAPEGRSSIRSTMTGAKPIGLLREIQSRSGWPRTPSPRIRFDGRSFGKSVLARSSAFDLTSLKEMSMTPNPAGV